MSDKPRSDSAEKLADKIAKSLGMALDENNEIRPATPEELAGDIPAPPERRPAVLSVGEAAILKQQKAEKKDADPPAPPETPPATPPATPGPAEPTSEPNLSPAPNPPLATAAPPAKPATPPATPPEATDEQKKRDEYLAALSPEQKREYDLAKFAETKHPEQYKGHADKVLDFFKKSEAFQKENPEAGADSEEWQDFIEENRPRYREGERWHLVEELATDTATERAKREIEAAREELTSRIKQVEVAPKIEKRIERFRKFLAEPKLPDGVEAADKAVVESVLGSLGDEGKIQQAFETNEVEAPIILAHEAAHREFQALMHGAKKFNPENEMHQWLSVFIQDQGRLFADQPVESKTVNGKTFLPVAEFNALAAENPAAVQKHWTFSIENIEDMIATDAHIAIQARYQRLKKSGFVRASRENLSIPENKTPVAGAERNPPRAGASIAPGAAATAKSGQNMSETALFLNRIFPGGAKIAGAE